MKPYAPRNTTSIPKSRRNSSFIDITDGETLASLQPDGMTRPVALFQLDPADLDKLDPVPRDDEYEPFLFVRQDDPLELVPLPPAPGLDDLDGVGPASAGRRLKDRAGRGRGGDEVAGVWI